MNEISTIGAPHNIEAEQMLLGSIMTDNATLDRVVDILRPDHFYDPVHREIYERCVARIQREHLVSPVTLKSEMDTHAGLQELGGSAYLAKLAGAALPRYVRDYAKAVIEQHDRRITVEALSAAQERLYAGEAPLPTLEGLAAVTQSLSHSDGQPVSVSFLTAMTEAIGAANEAYAGTSGGLMTGLTDLDKLLGGLVGGDMVILGGAPSMGKTSLAVHVANTVAERGQGVAIVSLEMTAPSLAVRTLSAKTSIPYSKIRSGDMSEAEFRKVIERGREMQAHPVEIVQPHVRDTAAIYAAVKRCRADLEAKGTPLAMVMIDYLQLVRAPGKSRYEQVTNISMQIKGLAMQLDVPVVALSQLSREVTTRDNKRPRMSDLRESGQLEQDADAILFAHREAYYLTREGPPTQRDGTVKEGDRADWQAAVEAQKNRMEIIVAKNRAGAIGTAHVGFHDATNRVWNLQDEGGDFA